MGKGERRINHRGHREHREEGGKGRRKKDEGAEINRDLDLDRDRDRLRVKKEGLSQSTQITQKEGEVGE